MNVARAGVLRELAERGSVTAVARALHLTPSAVSQQLKTLEREAGTALTERSGRALVLTPAGRVLADAAREVAVALERAEAAWADYVEQPRGVVTLSVFETGGQMLLPGLLRRMDGVPGLRIEVSDRAPYSADPGDLTADHDVVLGDGAGVLPGWRERGLELVELLREPLDVAMPEGHPLARRRELAPADVIGERWICTPRDLPYDRILQRIEAITGRDATVEQRLLDNGIVEALVAAGRGIAILPRFTTRDHGNGLVTRPLTGMRAERTLWAMCRPEVAVRPSVRLVLEALRAEAEDFVAARA
ncbi:MAG: LysR family transcriptional regulator [Actinomycetales bacterium]|nr:LysR family transcriptional regulator [Actinomycetales bacterium]